MKRYTFLVPLFILAVFSISIVFPLLSPGYVLTGDEIVTPGVFWPRVTSPAFLYRFLFAALSTVIPAYTVQKIVLFLIFFLSGWGMYRLVSVNNTVAKYFASFLYALNPFVYERVIAGHWTFLLGYGLFPFVVMATRDLIEKPGKKTAFLLAVVTTFLISISLHHVLIFAVFLLTYVVTYLVLHAESIVPVLKHTVFFLVFLFILNANWLIPVFVGNSELVATVFTEFDSADIIAFQSVPDKNFGLLFNLLSGYGFWAEVYTYFISPKHIVPVWSLLSGIVIALSVTGLVYFFKNRNKHTTPFLITLVIMFFISLDFAGGVALKSFAGTTFFLYETFPILKGFREPQKLVSVLFLCYAFFGSGGIDVLSQRFTRTFKYVVFGFLLLLPFLYTPTVFGGFWGQLKPAFYPNSWFEIKTFLEKDTDAAFTVFFPWHLYMRFKFIGNRVIAHPAPLFFRTPVLSAQNYGTVSLYSHDTRPEALHVEGLLAIEQEGINLLGDTVEEKPQWGRDLAAIEVKYILLFKDSDWKRYRFLNRQPDLVKEHEDDTLILYKNLAFGQPDPL